MLPACRTEVEGFAIPTFEVVPHDVEGFMEELWELQAAFHDCFARSEPRAHFFDYMVGQWSPLERKSIEPMALQVAGGTIRGMQRFLSNVLWDEAHMRWNYHQLVAEEMGAPDGVLMFDETGFVKKGTDSVGVARQYGGPWAKWRIARWGCLPAMPPAMGMPWWTSGYSCRKCGGRMRMRPAGPDVMCPPN
jgi:DDE superfamily endonuclease